MHDDAVLMYFHALCFCLFFYRYYVVKILLNSKIFINNLKRDIWIQTVNKKVSNTVTQLLITLVTFYLKCNIKKPKKTKRNIRNTWDSSASYALCGHIFLKLSTYQHKLESSRKWCYSVKTYQLPHFDTEFQPERSMRSHDVTVRLNMEAASALIWHHHPHKKIYWLAPNTSTPSIAPVFVFPHEMGLNTWILWILSSGSSSMSQMAPDKLCYPSIGSH